LRRLPAHDPEKSSPPLAASNGRPLPLTFAPQCCSGVRVRQHQPRDRALTIEVESESEV